MTVAVLVPFKAGCPHRERNWRWLRAWYEDQGFEVIEGSTDAPGFSRTQAILDARSRSDADVFVVPDADVWTDPTALDAGIREALIHGWAVPNGLLHRLSEASTDRVLRGEDWRGQSLSDDNPQDRKPYRVHPGGTLLVLTAEAFDTAPPDPRFVGWGQEDDAWRLALRTLVGPEWRGDADLVHLWHPAEPRQSRVVGNQPNLSLLRRYQGARTPDRMQALIEEGKSWHATSTSSSTSMSS